MTAVVSTETGLGPVPDGFDRHVVEQFLYREARLADEGDYDAWEALWTDDALYWVPIGGEGGDPQQEMSVIYDNRNRISTRLKQLTHRQALCAGAAVEPAPIVVQHRIPRRKRQSRRRHRPRGRRQLPGHRVTSARNPSVGRPHHLSVTSSR